MFVCVFFCLLLVLLDIVIRIVIAVFDYIHHDVHVFSLPKHGTAVSIDGNLILLRELVLQF